MQIVSVGNNLHEMSMPVFWEKYENYFKVSAAETLTEHGKLSLQYE